MRRTMKLISSLVFVSAAFVTACSWGDGSGTEQPPAPDASVSQNVCGDGSCAAAEIGYCTEDCGSGGGSGSGSGTSMCGNFVCDAGESNATCPNDCTSGGGSGSGSGSGDPTACIATCIAAPDPTACLLACLGGGGGGGGLGDDTGCTGGSPNGTCDTTEEASPFTCVSDCPLF